MTIPVFSTQAVNEIPWSLLNKVLQVPECLECPSVLCDFTLRLPWVSECPIAYRVPTDCLGFVQMRQNIESLFVWINKSIKNAALTAWLWYRDCWIQIVHKLIILEYLNDRHQYPSWLNLFFFSYIKLCWLKPYWKFEDYSVNNFECSEIVAIDAPAKKFCANILQKSSSVWRTLFHLLDLNLRCLISKLIIAFGLLRHSI